MDRIIILIGVILSTCVLSARAPLPKGEAAKIIKQFQGPVVFDEVSSYDDTGYWSSCWIYEKRIEVSDGNSINDYAVDLTIYIPNRGDLNDEQVPAVIMVPPIGGVNYLDGQMAKTFCSNDTAAIIIENDFANVQKQADGDLLPPEDHEQTYFRISVATRAVLQMISADPNMNAEKIGMFGVSLGGILSSFVMATQPEITAGYFIVAGGDVPNILAHSEQEEIARIRRKRMREENFETKAEYEAYVREHLTIDPVDIALTMIPDSIEMVVAERDYNVPTDNQMLLHEAFGRPQTQYYNDGHVDTIIASLLWGGRRREVARFFDKQFEKGNRRPQLFENLVPEGLFF